MAIDQTGGRETPIAFFQVVRREIDDLSCTSHVHNFALMRRNHHASLYLKTAAPHCYQCKVSPDRIAMSQNVLLFVRSLHSARLMYRHFACQEIAL